MLNLIEQPHALLAYADAEDAIQSLVDWMAQIEARDDVLHTVTCVDGSDTFPCQVTFPGNPGRKPLWGALCFHDYAETPYWSVHT